MKTTLQSCNECGRLFSAPQGIERCSNCSDNERAVYQLVEDAIMIDGLEEVSAIAAQVNLDEDTVNRIIDDLGYLAERVESPKKCRACGQRPRRRGRDYCTHCLVNLDADLRETKSELDIAIDKRNRRPEARLRDVSVDRILREKQRRTGHYRFDPVPRNIKRGR